MRSVWDKFAEALGDGCEQCLKTGYHERIGLFELLGVDESVRERILQRENASAIKSLAISGGMRSLRADGLSKAFAGVTAMDEVARVTVPDES